MEYGLWTLAGFRGTDGLSVLNGETVQLLPAANDNALPIRAGWSPRLLRCCEDVPVSD